MPMRGNPHQLTEIKRRIVLIGRVSKAAAPLVAQEAGEAAKVTIGAGQDPNGNAHPLTKDGRPPLTMLAAKVTAGVTGEGFEVRVGGSAGHHQVGAGHLRIIRRVLPGEGEDIPMAWTDRIVRVYRAQFQRAKGG